MNGAALQARIQLKLRLLMRTALDDASRIERAPYRRIQDTVSRVGLGLRAECL